MVSKTIVIKRDNSALFYPFVAVLLLVPSFLPARNFKYGGLRGRFICKQTDGGFLLCLSFQNTWRKLLDLWLHNLMSIKYKGVSIFKIPSGDNNFDKGWREKLLAVITRDREIDAALRERIKAKKLLICQRQFSEDQFYRHDSRATLVPGSIPSLNLPVKSFPPPPPTKLVNLPVSFSKRSPYLLPRFQFIIHLKNFYVEVNLLNIFC